MDLSRFERARRKACDWLLGEWAMITTRLGTVLLAVSTAAPYLAPVDLRFAWAGALAGVLLIFFREKGNA